MEVKKVTKYKCEHCTFEHINSEMVKVHESVCKVNQLHMLTDLEKTVFEAIAELFHPTTKWWPTETMIDEKVKDKYGKKAVMHALDTLMAGNLITSGWRDQGGWCYVYRVIEQ